MTNTTNTINELNELNERIARRAARREKLAEIAALATKEGELTGKIELLEEKLAALRAELHAVEIEQVRAEIAYNALI